MNNHQRGPRWRLVNLGFSSTTIGDYGCTISAIGNIVGVTPDIVNDRLKAVNGFAQGNLVIWSKIAEAFPDFKVIRQWSYNNDDVLKHVPNVICEVSAAAIGSPRTKHWVQYIGGGKCNDPWTGRVRPTSDFGTPSGYAIITKIKDTPKPPTKPQEPTVEPKPVTKPIGINFFDKGDSFAWREVVGHNYDKDPVLVGFNEILDAKNSALTPWEWLKQDQKLRLFPLIAQEAITNYVKSKPLSAAADTTYTYTTTSDSASGGTRSTTESTEQTTRTEPIESSEPVGTGDSRVRNPLSALSDLLIQLINKLKGR